MRPQYVHQQAISGPLPQRRGRTLIEAKDARKQPYISVSSIKVFCFMSQMIDCCGAAVVLLACLIQSLVWCRRGNLQQRGTKFNVRIWHERKRLYLGSFAAKEDAFRAVDKFLIYTVNRYILHFCSRMQPDLHATLVCDGLAA